MQVKHTETVLRDREGLAEYSTNPSFNANCSNIKIGFETNYGKTLGWSLTLPFASGFQNNPSTNVLSLLVFWRWSIEEFWQLTQVLDEL
jgi:hypothetical protein